MKQFITFLLLATCACCNVNATALTVELSKNYTISESSAILFDNVSIDVDNSFERQFGAYQCPSSGLYSFHWTLQAPNGRAWAALYKSGEAIKLGPLTAEIAGLLSSGSSSMSSIVECNQGEWVYLRAIGYPNTDSCNKIEAVYSSLTAFRLQDSSHAFTAYMSQNTEIPTSSTNVQYDATSINIGDVYSNGVARCNADGLMVFTVSTNLQSNNGATLLYKNNNNFQGIEMNLVFRHASGSNTYGTAAGTRIVACQDGEFFSLRSEQAPRTFVAHDSAWSGFMLPPDTPAFSVQLGSNNEYISGSTFLFSTVITNVGNFYKPSFGAFICPDSGLYAFFWSVMAVDENYNDRRAAEAELVSSKDGISRVLKRGPKTGQVTLPGTSNTKSSSTQAVVRCEEDMAISVKTVVSDRDRQAYDGANTAFSGFKLPTFS